MPSVINESDPGLSTSVAGMLGRQFPKVESMLRDAAEDLLAFTSFPVAHWKKIWPRIRWSG